MNTSLPGVFLLVACLFVMRGGSPLQAGTLAENPPSEMTTVKGHAHDRHYLKSVGPGEPPHTHAVAPIRFPQIAEIAMSPSKVPAPAAQRSSQTMRFHLEAKEGVSFLADGTSYLYWTFNAAVPGPMLRVQVGDTVELTLSNHSTSTTNTLLTCTR